MSSPVSDSSCTALIAKTLSTAGVRHVFGHPGGEIVNLIHALTSHGVEFVLTGHETAAAVMAGTAGRLTGRPGVCLATLGPGACNLTLGVACAFLDRDPMLALSARAASECYSGSSKQSVALNDLFAPITKWSLELNGVRTTATICSALEVAARPPRGPVYISFPPYVAIGPDLADGEAPVPPPERPCVEQPLERVGRVLNSARWPIGVVGIALDPRKDRDRIRRFLRETGIPYVSLPQAKGVADESVDGFLGTVGVGAGDRFLVERLLESDCLLGLGFDPVESSQDWHLRRPVYSLANSPTGFGRYQPDLEVIGNVGELVEKLGAQYRGAPEWRPEELRRLHRCTEDSLRPALEATSGGLSPFHVVDTVRRAAPEQTVMSVDVGAHKMLLTQTWRAPEPGSFLTSNGLSAMGYGVPAALTAALFEPTRPVIGFVGDGGFAMMVQELETARRLELKPLVVVFCDRTLAIIKIAQRARGLPHQGVDFAPVDWAKVAEGFGANSQAPATLADVDQAVRQWLACPELTVLAVPIDPELYLGLSY